MQRIIFCIGKGSHDSLQRVEVYLSFHSAKERDEACMREVIVLLITSLYYYYYILLLPHLRLLVLRLLLICSSKLFYTVIPLWICIEVRFDVEGYFQLFNSHSTGYTSFKRKFN